MIVVRDTFQIHPERMKEARALAKEDRRLAQKHGYPLRRIMTDLSGEYYTLIFEGEVASLSEFQELMGRAFADKEWQEWYGRFRQLIRGGRREFYTLLE